MPGRDCDAADMSARKVRARPWRDASRSPAIVRPLTNSVRIPNDRDRAAMVGPVAEPTDGAEILDAEQQIQAVLGDRPLDFIVDAGHLEHLPGRSRRSAGGRNARFSPSTASRGAGSPACGCCGSGARWRRRSLASRVRPGEGHAHRPPDHAGEATNSSSEERLRSRPPPRGGSPDRRTAAPRSRRCSRSSTHSKERCQLASPNPKSRTWPTTCDG